MKDSKSTEKWDIFDIEKAGTLFDALMGDWWRDFARLPGSIRLNLAFSPFFENSPPVGSTISLLTTSFTGNVDYNRATTVVNKCR